MAARHPPSRSHDAAKGAVNTASHPYPPSPGSPTLTNPDMILPDYDDDDDHSDLQDHRVQSPIGTWRGTQASSINFHLPQQGSFPLAPAQPSTPIIYGNGTMLSDIGEVTEVESNIGGRRRRPSSGLYESDDGDAMLQSAGQGDQDITTRRSKILARQRRLSVDSSSTITTQQDPRAEFGEEDDLVSVDDSNFQGDDEESVADSLVQDNGIYTSEATNRYANVTPGDDRYMTNSISKRAEQILANAKRRLTTMEGNLSRARSSLSYPALSEGSTPSPPMVRPATALRESTYPTSPSHSRNTSENSLIDASRVALSLQRSASALGAAGGYRPPLTVSRSLGTLDSSASNRLSHHPLDTALEPLSEDEDCTAPAQTMRYTIQQSDLTSGSTLFHSAGEGGIPRAASAAQMRDLQEQMNGLKGKISTLKEKARADSMKRRSLQTLRTPSPFTHARWDPGFIEPRIAPSTEVPVSTEPTPSRGEASAEVPNAPIVVETHSAGDSPPPDEVVAPDEPDSDLDADGVIQLKDSAPSPTSQLSEYNEDVRDRPEEQAADYESHEAAGSPAMADEGFAQGDTEYDEIEDYSSETGDSVYHDTYQHAVSHEDREDAFDYEHFYLHSAMGSLSRRYGRRDSSASDSSRTSVETTRGPIADPRRRSMDTLSSVRTYATATEGRESRSSTLPEEEVNEEKEGLRSEDWMDPPSGNCEALKDKSGRAEANEDGQTSRHRPNSGLHRPSASLGGAKSSSLKRPSISSLESTGTTRSFPLVNKTKINGGVLTPGGSPDQELTHISAALMNGTAVACRSNTDKEGEMPTAMKLLAKDDRAGVEGIIAGLAKCVLGLSEMSRASAEGRLYRKRIDAARRILEGRDE